MEYILQRYNEMNYQVINRHGATLNTLLLSERSQIERVLHYNENLERAKLWRQRENHELQEAGGGTGMNRQNTAHFQSRETTPCDTYKAGSMS